MPTKTELDEVYRLAVQAKTNAANVKTRINERYSRFGDHSIEELTFLELAKGLDLLCDAVRKLTV